MKKLKLQIPYKPLSVNGKYTIAAGQRRITKRHQVYAFEKQVREALNLYRDDIRFFTNNLMSNECLSLSIEIFVPAVEFFNKKGTMNLRCMDASNALKILEDCIYNELGINDALNIHVSARKHPIESERYLTLVEIEKMKIPQALLLRELPSQLEDHSAVKLN